MREPGATFCQPTVRFGVEFIDFTDDGYLRSPRSGVSTTSRSPKFS
jgi:hypothetical protein